MMKNKLFSKLSTKLVLAAVALTTLTFTSCDKEDFDVKIIYNPASVTITPQVMYVEMNSDGTTNASDVTSAATLTWTGVTASGTTATIAGTNTNPAISSTTVTISATYNDVSGSTTVITPALQTGIVAMTPTIWLVKGNTAAGDNFTYVMEEVGSESLVGPEVEWTPTGHTYTHAGKNWIENPSEYFMTVSVKATFTTKREATGTPTILDTENAAKLTTMIESLQKGMTYSYTHEEKTYTFTASAYALFRAYTKAALKKVTYKLVKIAKDGTRVLDPAATFQMLETEYNAVFPEEMEHPSHAGHYQHGHGHDAHGNSTNAGGGIINAD